MASNSFIRLREQLSAFISLSPEYSLNCIMFSLSSMASKKSLSLALDLFSRFTRAPVMKKEIIIIKHPIIIPV